MKKIHKTPQRNKWTSYKRTPYDREEKPKITFDLNKPMTMRERKEEEARKKLFEHRWREEQKLKARQKRLSKKWRRENNGVQDKWRDVLKQPVERWEQRRKRH